MKNVYISIDGVLRNTLQKIEYHYKDLYFNSDIDPKSLEIDNDGQVIVVENSNIDFDYRINYPITNEDLLNCFTFQSKEEFSNFLFIEYPLEIFGHAGISYPNVFSDLNTLIANNPDIDFTVIGIDQFGKSKPSTLFFLSKNGFMGNNIKFVKFSEIEKEWNNCDLWITDDKRIIDSCPEEKKCVKFLTNYNSWFTNKEEIDNLSKIEIKC